MARTRNIKAGFSTNEHLAELGPLAHLLFAALWPHCDREGRMEDRPKRIKVLCLPFYECDVDALLTLLATCPEPFIERYEVDGKKYIQVVNWHTHQTPYTREPESIIPANKPKHCRSTTRARRDSCLSTESRNQERDSNQESNQEGESRGETATGFDAFWGAVHRKVGKAEAERAYDKAVKRLAIKHPDPHGYLIDRMAVFAASPAAHPTDHSPIHPATWLNHGRYDDDPTTWSEVRGSPRNGQSHVICYADLREPEPDDA